MKTRYSNDIYKELHGRIKAIILDYIDGKTSGTRHPSKVLTRAEYDDYFNGKKKSPESILKTYATGKNFEGLLDDVKWYGHKSFKSDDEYKDFARSVLKDIASDILASDKDKVNESNTGSEHKLKLFNRYVSNSDFKNIDKFIENDDVNMHDDDGNSPLTIAIALMDTDTIRKLVNKGADVNYNDDTTNLTPLIYVCGERTYQPSDVVEAASILVNAGADVNAKDTFGNTALIMCDSLQTNDKHSELQVVIPLAKYLLENGADPGITNEFGGGLIDNVSKHVLIHNKDIQEAIIKYWDYYIYDVSKVTTFDESLYEKYGDILDTHINSGELGF